MDEGQRIETNSERLMRRSSRYARVCPGLSVKGMTCGTPCQQREREREGTISGGEGNGPWAGFGPSGLLIFSYFLSLLFSIFFCENFKKHQK
jgi:hypothetical protein